MPRLVTSIAGLGATALLGPLGGEEYRLDAPHGNFIPPSRLGHGDGAGDGSEASGDHSDGNHSDAAAARAWDEQRSGIAVSRESGAPGLRATEAAAQPAADLVIFWDAPPQFYGVHEMGCHAERRHGREPWKGHRNTP